MKIAPRCRREVRIARKASVPRGDVETRLGVFPILQSRRRTSHETEVRLLEVVTASGHRPATELYAMREGAAGPWVETGTFWLLLEGVTDGCGEEDPKKLSERCLDEAFDIRRTRGRRAQFGGRHRAELATRTPAE